MRGNSTNHNGLTASCNCTNKRHSTKARPDTCYDLVLTYLITQFFT